MTKKYKHHTNYRKLRKHKHYTNYSRDQSTNFTKIAINHISAWEQYPCQPYKRRTNLQTNHTAHTSTYFDIHRQHAGVTIIQIAKIQQMKIFKISTVSVRECNKGARNNDKEIKDMIYKRKYS